MNASVLNWRHGTRHWACLHRLFLGNGSLNLCCSAASVYRVLESGFHHQKPCLTHFSAILLKQFNSIHIITTFSGLFTASFTITASEGVSLQTTSGCSVPVISRTASTRYISAALKTASLVHGPFTNWFYGSFLLLWLSTVLVPPYSSNFFLLRSSTAFLYSISPSQRVWRPSIDPVQASWSLNPGKRSVFSDGYTITVSILFVETLKVLLTVTFIVALLYVREETFGASKRDLWITVNRIW